MTTKRDSLISLSETSYYHCCVRCVRRAYLCGDDKVSGNNFDHRRQWLVSRFRFLSYVYAIDICAYAVMSNHYHVVLHVDVKRAEGWTECEVVDRWLQLYKGNALVDRWLADSAAMTQAELDKVAEIICEWRERLTSISWFMRGVNETIARMANEEDRVTGRFWEGRFKSQALLDVSALLSCMAYVDLNPVRAAMADDLVDSDFTSIQQRLFDELKQRSQASETKEKSINPIQSKRLKAKETYLLSLKQAQSLESLPQQKLMGFDGGSFTSVHDALPFTFADYLELVDSTGRVIRKDKRGFITAQSERLITSMGLDGEQWVEQVRHFERCFGSCAGGATQMTDYANRFGRKWSRGVQLARNRVRH